MNKPSFICVNIGDQGGSAFYRVITPTMAARKKGILQLRTPDKMLFFPKEYLDAIRPDAILFHRSHTNNQIQYLNKIMHEVDALKVYTIDDWVGKVPKESPHYKDVPKNIDKDIRKAIDKCDRLIVTTDLLANIYGYKKETYVIPNYLSADIWAPVYKHSRPNNDFRAIPRIGWSGGMGHPGDLRILKDIAEILGDRVRWVFLGDMPIGFDQGNSEVHQPVVVTQYTQALYNLNLDLALAPLLDNDFNRAKSNLRVLEYGACGYPVLASNILTYKNMPITLRDNNAKWWAEAILSKLENREALVQEGVNLQNWIWENYKLEDHLEEYGNILSPDRQCFIPSIPEVTDTVDVLITTHNKLEIAKRCINSVIESRSQNTTPINIIVSDNASTENEFQEYLDTLPSKGITVLKQPIDLGYIHSINNACSINPNNDVITLNSDTYVVNDWIDRLRTKAYSSDRIATVTALSNNGSICSYPNTNGTPLKVAEVKFYDSLVKEINNEQIFVLPSSVNYCAYMKRKVIAEIGLFDEHAFGRGYGDENDWCMRAMEHGYLNIVAPNVYVGHDHGAIFGAERQTLLQKSSMIMAYRWQSYPKIVKQWSESQVLRPLHELLDVETIAKLSIEPRTLYIGHGFGGGLETYLQSQLTKAPNSMILRNDPSHPGILSFNFQHDDYHNLPIVDTRLSSMIFLRDTFLKFKIDHISVQTTFGYDYTFPIWIMNLAELMGINYSVMLHDYLTVCPRLRLVQNITYCGEPTADDCNNCIKTYGSALGQVNIYDWRSMYENFLKKASHVYAPSNDLANRIKTYFDVPIDVVPHEPNIRIGEIKGSLPYDGGPLRVAVIGSLSPDKGALIVRDCATYCLENNIPVSFHVFGNLIDNISGVKLIQQTPNLRIFNAYKEEDLKPLLELNKCHLSFFPALWPETYSYTLSHAFRAALFPVCYDIGAIAERIREKNFGHILPFTTSTSIPDTVNALLEIAKGLRKDDN